MLKYTAPDCGVDSGMIMVCCLSYLNKKKDITSIKEIERLGKVIDVPNGKYSIHYSLPEDIDPQDERDISDADLICYGDESLEVTSGKVVIIDPCYVKGKKVKGKDGWDEWLTDTDYGNKLLNDRVFIINQMGGDGTYTVDLTFTSEVVKKELSILPKKSEIEVLRKENEYLKKQLEELFATVKRIQGELEAEWEKQVG